MEQRKVTILKEFTVNNNIKIREIFYEILGDLSIFEISSNLKLMKNVERVAKRLLT